METNDNAMNTSLDRIGITLLSTRVALGAIVFAHGAQKLFGWFDGYGFAGTMEYFTNTIGLPYMFALVVILAESLGMVLLTLGLLTRPLAVTVILIMAGAILKEHGQFGFFMNWSGTQSGEGFEFHLLIIALAITLVLNGGGVYSLDNVLSKVKFGLKKKASLV